MILDEYTKMKWNPNNKKYYIDKGYEFSKMNDVFDLKITDLNTNSPVKIFVKCDVCEYKRMIKYRDYFRSISNGGYYSCSQKCSNGKSKSTCLSNYGTETFIQSEIGKKTIKETNLKKYGKEFAIQNESIKMKVISTCKRKYGTNFVFQNEEVKEKCKKTWIEKYGVDNPSKSNFVKEKYKNTCIKKYGVQNTFQSEEIKNKIRESCLIKYGFEHHTQNKEIMDKITETQISKYGELWKTKVPKYNKNSILYLDIISDVTGLHIQHALNGGEKKLIKYWIDGYIESYNIEWDEPSHKYRTEYDSNREKFLRENKNCRFIRINEEEFLKNVQEGLTKVVNQIQSLLE